MFTSEMIIFTRTFNLLDWLLPKTERFPKRYRHTVTHRLMSHLLDFQEALFDAHTYTGKVRLRHLKRADAQLNKVRFYLRLIHHWGWLSHGQYQHVSQMVAEVGRLLGGWIQQTNVQ